MTYFVLLIWLIATGTADAQYQSAGFQSDVSKVGSSAVPFLTIGIGARATAMGGAFTSVASDVTALYWNPAGIASFDQNRAPSYIQNGLLISNMILSVWLFP